MAIAFATQTVNEKAKRLGLADNLGELLDNCEARMFDEAFQLFEIRYPYLYKRISNFRLIAKVETVKVSIPEMDTPDSIEAICILDILKKGDKDAQDFNADHFKYGQEKLEKLIDHHALREHVEEELRKGFVDSTPSKKEMPDDLYRWLEPFERTENSDDLILESKDWVEKFKSTEYQKHWATFLKLVRMSSYSFLKPVEEGSRIFIAKDDHSDRKILYTKFLLEETSGGTESVIFLLNALNPDEPINIGPYDWAQNFDDIIKNIDVIAPYADRAYLSLILPDDDLWYQVMKSDAANPALSAEELALLARVRHAPIQERVLPIFINGRAGSGKSTMLYHLFSDYVHRKATLGLSGEILFLTYSESLLETARENVRKLVGARFDLNDDIRPLSIDDTLPNYPDYFQSFLGFVQKLIPKEILLKEFPQDKYADFRVFKKFFTKSVTGTKLSPDICWHVIRTFIKGYSSNGYLEPEDYDDLPKPEKSVSPEKYAQVYRSVWEKYKESGYWDTQDLIRMAISEKWISPKYTVLFCDESQDFTRVELEFIRQLLVYQDYDLGWTKYIRLPFAMAGDPFQTLNPTGFRWEGIKASFYDEIIGNLDPYGHGNIAFDYKELFYNYRSQAPIVRLSNLFQLWREVLFGTSDVYPQKPWRSDEYIIPPRLYVLNDNLTEDAFLKMAENSVVILPCEHGQEKEYIEQNPLLVRLSQMPNYPTFQSPMTAKGLEYTRVILFGFGDACPEKFFSTPIGETQLENEYFLNKLYVAATRAMQSLIIVDTKTGVQKLWKNSQGQETVNTFIEKSKNPKKWQPNSATDASLVSGVTSGDYYDPHIEQRTQDPLEIARKLEELGQNNAELLKQAMDFYQRAGEEGKALHCKAKSMEADGLYKEAGDEFLSQGRAGDAERCYWKGECWPDLNLWYISHKNGEKLHFETARFMVRNDNDFVSVATYLGFVSQLRRDGIAIPLDIQFQKAIRNIAKMLLSNIDAPRKTVVDFANLMANTPSIRQIVGNSASASLYYKAEDFERAVQIWEYDNERDLTDYKLAKAALTTDLKEKIYWLNLAHDNKKIIELHIRNGSKTEIDKDSLRLIAEAYCSEARLLEAYKLIWSLGDYSHALELYEKLTSRLPAGQIYEIFTESYRFLVSSKELDQAYDWYKAAEKQLESNQREQHIKSYISKLLEMDLWLEAIHILRPNKAKKGFRLQGLNVNDIHSLIFTELARSPKLLDASVPEKNEIINYAREMQKLGFAHWSSLAPVEVMGAVMERAGTLIDGLSFYESVEKESLSPEQTTFVRQRWLKVKSKQVEKLQADINKTDARERDKYARNWNNRKSELDKNLSDWRMDVRSIANLPDYPVIRVDESDELVRKIKIDWQSPTCKISIAGEAEIFSNLADGTIIAFPPGPILIEKRDGLSTFRSEKLPINGELVHGNSLKIYVNNKLIDEYSLS